MWVIVKEMSIIKYKIWDKKESINNVSSEDVLASRPELNNIEVILLTDDYGNVTNIEEPNILCSVLGIPTDTPIEEIAEAFIQHLEEQKQNAISLHDQVNNLEEENSSLVLELAEKDNTMTSMQADLASIILEIAGGNEQ